MASPAPKSPEQSEKNRKYDRQLRLWGDHGQAALEGAHICVINATGLGTEILKSLVLPGIGAFTIVDGKKITNEDIGANGITQFVLYTNRKNACGSYTCLIGYREPGYLFLHGFSLLMKIIRFVNNEFF